MKKWIWILFLIVGCARDSAFLNNVVSTRYEKTYPMSRSTSEGAAIEVDILWVIDNSPSMGSYQQQVIANSDQFMRQFTATSALHWKMGLISTDDSESPYMGFASPVDWKTPKSLDIFNTAIGKLGTGGSATEKSFDPVLKALADYRGFLRPGANLALIMVSDEEEQSGITAADFVGKVAGYLGGDASRFAAYRVNCCSGTTSQNYIDIVKLTKGKTYDLQAKDYGVLLAKLGSDLVQRLSTGRPVVLLDQRPDPKTIQVTYKGRPVFNWTYDPIYNVIRLDPAEVDFSVMDVKVSFELEPVYSSP